MRPGLGKVTLTLASTLLDAKAYPAAELLELRLRRWDVETNLRHLKTTLGLDVLRCKSEQGVRKELAIFSIVYNLVRVVMLEAARRQEVPVARISFADACTCGKGVKRSFQFHVPMLSSFDGSSTPHCSRRLGLSRHEPDLGQHRVVPGRRRL